MKGIVCNSNILIYFYLACCREADKQEAVATEALRERRAQLEADGGCPAGFSGLLIDEATDAVIRIGATGFIKMANKNVRLMFGYRKVCCIPCPVLSWMTVGCPVRPPWIETKHQ